MVLLLTGATIELLGNPQLPEGHQVPVGNGPALEDSGMVIVDVMVEASVVVDSKVVVHVSLLDTYVLVTVHGVVILVGIFVTTVV